MVHGHLIKWLEDVKQHSIERSTLQTNTEDEEFKPLDVKIHEWWTALPESEQYKPFSMSEFIDQFKASGSKIGPVLHHLGWERKRYWGKGSHANYWFHPIVID